jgi:hypothetical protein
MSRGAAASASAYPHSDDLDEQQKSFLECAKLHELPEEEEVPESGQIDVGPQPCAVEDCPNKTAHDVGFLCAAHLKDQRGVEIRRATNTEAGLGLFATKLFAVGDQIVPYTGDVITLAQLQQRKHSRYVWKLSNALYLDAARTNTDVGRMANTSEPGQANNADFFKDTQATTSFLAWGEHKQNDGYEVWLKATKKIDPDQEILVPYGFVVNKKKGSNTGKKKRSNAGNA